MKAIFTVDKNIVIRWCKQTARTLAGIFGALLLVTAALGQAAPETQAKPPATPAAYHIGDAEAKELFRSLDMILQFASEHSGLPIHHEVKKKLATREEVQHYLEKRMHEAGNERFDRMGRSLEKLGLLPRGFKLREYMLSLYKEQVEGWYDPKSKTVYLLDWVPPDAQKPVMAHELTHALQDQNYELDKWLNVADDTRDETGQSVIDEQREARQSIAEGQAMVVLYDYMLAPSGQSVEAEPAMADMLRASITDEGAENTYAHAPICLREMMLFPYTFGTDFVMRVLARRGKQAAFAGVLEHPPLDTHQVMEPAAYLSGEPQRTIRVLPVEKVLGSGWRREDFSGLGEVDLRVILRQWSGDEAAKMASAWRGGYYAVVTQKGHAPTSQGQGSASLPLVLVLKFDSPETARKFAAIYEAELPRRYQSVQADKAGGEWMTEEGSVRMVIEGSAIIALESFAPADAVRLLPALRASVHEDVEIPAATE